MSNEKEQQVNNEVSANGQPQQSVRQAEDIERDIWVAKYEKLYAIIKQSPITRNLSQHLDELVGKGIEVEDFCEWLIMHYYVGRGARFYVDISLT